MLGPGAPRFSIWLWAGASVLLALTVYLGLADSDTPLAVTLALPAAIISATAALLALRRPDDLDHAARRLAVEVARDRLAFLQHSLGDEADARPADVAIGHSAGLADQLGPRWRRDGGGPRSSVLELAAYYKGLTRGRLAILGEAGSGKSVALSVLALELLADADVQPDQDRIRGARRIPIVLSLSSWVDAPRGSDTPSPDATARALDEWIHDSVARTYGVSRNVVDRLGTAGRFLPLLDGLDEMDVAPGAPNSRASSVIRALNARGRSPFVLACRTSDYRSLVSRALRAEETVGFLQDAEHIVLENLTHRDLRHYLARKFPSSHEASMPEARWGRFLKALESHHGKAVEAQFLRPWRAFLLASVYKDPESEPASLFERSPEEVVPALLAGFVPAVFEIGFHVQDRPKWITRESAEAGLTLLAHHLRDTGEVRRWSRTDIFLDDLWPLGGWRRMRVITAAFALSPLALMPLAVRWLLEESPDHRLTGWVFIASIALAAGVGSLFAIPSRPRALERLTFEKFQTRAGRTSLALVALFSGIAFAMIGVFLAWVNTEPLTRMAVWGGIAGVAFGTVFDLAGDLRAVTRPSDVLRWDLAAQLSAACVYPVFFVGVGWAHGLRGFGIGLLVALWYFSVFSSWTRYAVAMLLLRVRIRQKFRPAEFLDWCHQVGIVRLAGSATQFRHDELRAHYETRALVGRDDARTVD